MLLERLQAHQLPADSMSMANDGITCLAKRSWVPSHGCYPGQLCKERCACAARRNCKLRKCSAGGWGGQAGWIKRNALLSAPCDESPQSQSSAGIHSLPPELLIQVCLPNEMTAALSLSSTPCTRRIAFTSQMTYCQLLHLQ